MSQFFRISSIDPRTKTENIEEHAPEPYENSRIRFPDWKKLQ